MRGWLPLLFRFLERMQPKSRVRSVCCFAGCNIASTSRLRPLRTSCILPPEGSFALSGCKAYESSPGLDHRCRHLSCFATLVENTVQSWKIDSLFGFLLLKYPYWREYKGRLICVFFYTTVLIFTSEFVEASPLILLSLPIPTQPT